MSSWNRTTIGFERAGLDGKISDGKFLGKWHIMGRDTKVLGGAYLGAGSREALIVEDTQMLRELYDKAKIKASINGIVIRENVLQAVYDTVKETIKHNENLVKAMTESFRGDVPISLDYFLGTGTGVCRHMSTACAALLELFKADSHIRGTPSVDRNEKPGEGAHSWCRYTNAAGEIYILDVSLNYAGPLADAPKEKANKWEYDRPEELTVLRELKV